MTASRLRYEVDPDEEAFLGAFSPSWTDEQLDLMTSGFKSPPRVGGRAGDLPDGDEVDPRTDPELARRILLSPRSRLVVGEQPFVFPLLPLLADARGQVPAAIELLAEQYDLYLLQFTVEADPQGRERITALELTYRYPDDEAFRTYRLLPDTTVEERFAAGTQVQVGLRAGLEFDLADIPGADILPVDAAAQADVGGQILVRWRYTVQRALIRASGQGSGYASWSIAPRPSLLGRVDLAVVLCAPKAAHTLPLMVEGEYRIARGITWWERATVVKIGTDEALPLILPTTTPKPRSEPHFTPPN